MRIVTLALALSLAAPLPAAAQDIDFGDDSSTWANNGNCDDRRFTGPGMGEDLDWDDAGRDRTDCMKAFLAGKLKLWTMTAALAATDCAAIEWGDDENALGARDGYCDDPRFEGMAMAGILLAQDEGHDATDCRRMCDLSLIGLRNY